MAEQRVDIKVRIPLEVDTGAAEQSISNLPKRVRQAAEQATEWPGRIGWVQPQRHATEKARQEVDLQTRVHEKLREALGPQVSFLKNKKEINALYKEELAHVRTMEEELNRLKRTEHGLSQDQLRRREQDAREARHFVNRLRDTIAVGTAQEALSAPATGLGSGVLQGVGVRSAFSGGLIGKMADMAEQLIANHPILSTAIGAIGSSQFLAALAYRHAQPSLEIEQGFLNVGRRTGVRGLYDAVEPTLHGTVAEQFRQLGLAGEDVQRMAEAYGIPGSKARLLRDLEAQGGFARAYGFEPEQIAGLGRRITQLGAAEPGQHSAFWNLMSAAVLKGQKAGIDSSETMRGLLALTERSTAHLGVVSRGYVAGLAGMQAILGEGESRFFKGERGASQVARIVEGVTNPVSVGAERILMNAVMSQFGGVPSAEQIGLTGYQAASYGQMTDVDKLRVVLSRFPALLADPSQRKAMGGAFKELGRYGTGLESLFFAQLFKMRPGEVLEASAALTQDVEHVSGAARAKELAGRPLSALGELLTSGHMGKVMTDLISGQTPTVELSGYETMQQLQKERAEQFSRIIADSTDKFILFNAELAGAAQRLANFLIQEMKSGGPPVTPIPGSGPSVPSASGTYLQPYSAPNQP